MVRNCGIFLVFVVPLLGAQHAHRAEAAPPAPHSTALVGNGRAAVETREPDFLSNQNDGFTTADTLPELFPVDPSAPAVANEIGTAPLASPPDSLDAYAPSDSAHDPPLEGSAEAAWPGSWFGLRRYSTHGRNAGLGVPLVGTSWLNRPYYAGIELGPVWVTKAPQPHVSQDLDLLGGVYLGDDWDYYWGGELAAQRATPELINSLQPAADRGDRLGIWTASLLYYPWGDSLYRPYWRCGIGAMEIDWPTDDGHRRDEALWAIPLGVGIKYPFRRWLAVRAEFGDTIGLGNSGVATQHDLAITFALEWRFGAHPRSYWPWNPSRHIW